MSEIQVYTDFKLGDYKLSDFRGTIYSESTDGNQSNETPSPRHITTDLPRVHGSLYQGTTYDARIITVPIFLKEEISNFDKFKAWLCKDEEQTFYYTEDYREIDVVYNKGMDLTAYYDPSFRGLTTLEFIAFNPLWRLRQEQVQIISNPVLNTPYVINNKATKKSSPLIKIVPTLAGDITLTFNDLPITLTNVGLNGIIIDSKKGEIYEYVNDIKVNAFLKFYSNEYYRFPKIIPFQLNTITVTSGEVAQIEITPNALIL